MVRTKTNKGRINKRVKKSSKKHKRKSTKRRSLRGGTYPLLKELDEALVSNIKQLKKFQAKSKKSKHTQYQYSDKFLSNFSFIKNHLPKFWAIDEINKMDYESEENINRIIEYITNQIGEKSKESQTLSKDQDYITKLNAELSTIEDKPIWMSKLKSPEEDTPIAKHS